MSATDDAFACFRRSLELTGLQESLVANRQATVRAAIEGRLAVSASFLTGSYRRHTLITPLRQADVDIVVVLDRDYRRRGARAVLELVKSALRETYPASSISRNGQAVTITFADFTVDVVPAFATRWWDDDGWDICNSGDNTWIRTNPEKHIELSSKINQRTGGLLVPTVKMLKAWNRNADRPLRSFHLEVLAWNILDPGWFLAGWWGAGVGMGTDPDNVRRFFAEAPGRLQRKLTDPACGSADVSAYLNGSARQDAISKIMTAASRCEQADQFRAGGKEAEACRIYRQVFGDAFPG